MRARTLIIGAGIAVAALPLAFFVFSSTGEDVRAGDEDAPVVLHAGNLGEPSTLDPQQVDGTWEGRIVSDMFEGLYTNAADGSVILSDAQAVDISEDGLTYRFILRDGLVWSDGVPLTAHDYEYAFRRMVTPETAAPFASFFYNVVNGRAINGGRIDDPAELGVQALDDHTLRIQLIMPDPNFDALLSSYVFFPIPRHAVEEYGDRWPRAGNMVTNGPYILAEWVPNDFVHVVRNPNFWDSANVEIDEVYYYPTEDSSAALRRFRAGELDMDAAFPEQQIDWLREHMPDDVHIDPSTCVGYISMNTRQPPFDDVRVRQALSMSVDRDLLVGQVLRMGETPAYSMVTPFAPDYPNPQPAWVALTFPERQTRARALLADAGYGPENPLHFVYRYRESIKNRRAAISIANMWHQIGVDVDLVNTEVAIHYDDLQAGNFQLGDAGWCPFVRKPEELLGLSHSDHAEFNYAGYYNADFERLYDEALTVADLHERNQILAHAETILLADMPIIPTYYYVNKNLVGPQVQGWEENPTNTHLTRWLSIDESRRPEQESLTDRIMRWFN